MDKPSVNIIEFKELYNILLELDSAIHFKINYYDTESEILKLIENEKININYSTIVLKKPLKKINGKNIVIFNNLPLRIDKILDQINIHLIKQKYDLQSNFKIGEYSLDLNSRTISKNQKKLNLTEREIDILIFLSKQDVPQKIDVLQNKVWNYSSDLETHTVETHIYRLRKKIKDAFNDDSFIISKKDGYLVS
jgi:DNA-binding CsgD family transcriptional regulator